MRRVGIAIVLLAALAVPARAQFGKNVVVPAGTPEDKALAEIYAATDPAQKIALLDTFVSQFGSDPDMVLLADELYFSAYSDRKDYGKVFEYGDKVLALDPDNLTMAINLVRAAQEQGNLDKEFDSGERLGAILTRYKAQPAPSGTAAADWEQKKAEKLAGVKDQVDYAERLLFSSASQLPDPGRKAAVLERFVAAFPDSPYAENAQALVATAYEQAQDYPKMVAFAQRVLARDPDNIMMNDLLADYWSERGQQLNQAETAAKKVLVAVAGAKKPEGVGGQQWNQQVGLQKGIAYSALGQVYVNRNLNAQAVDAFRQADPLLKGNDYYYGRNLYRLGFTLAKMKRIPEARVVLTEAVSVNSPYRALAQQTLDKIGGPARGRPAKKSP